MATKDREEKSWFEKFAENETCRKWVVIAGVAGIALIFLSGLFSPGKEETQEASSQPAAQSAQAYTQELEQSLAELVTNIQGAGNAKVMVMFTDGNTTAGIPPAPVISVSYAIFLFRAFSRKLFDNFCYYSRSYCSSAFSDRESQSFFDRYLVDQFDFHRYVVSRHAHFCSCR